MAKECVVCGKGKISGNKVSHSVRRTRRTWKPNVKKVKAIVDGSPKRITVCTRCLRSGKIERAI
ncbi:50S ribosomal protein L28 [Wukongibacter sp. M2B1]|uniref:50S ribosomal protein L28 n=1 Tax=Wukongibacter TaxID=1884926 RepID=UPI003D7C04C2